MGQTLREVVVFAEVLSTTKYLGELSGDTTCFSIVVPPLPPTGAGSLSFSPDFSLGLGVIRRYFETVFNGFSTPLDQHFSEETFEMVQSHPKLMGVAQTEV